MVRDQLQEIETIHQITDTLGDLPLTIQNAGEKWVIIYKPLDSNDAFPASSPWFVCNLVFRCNLIQIDDKQENIFHNKSDYNHIVEAIKYFIKKHQK